MLADNRCPHGLNTFDLGFDDVENNIDIMDHKVKHHTDIGAAALVNTQSTGFYEHGFVNNIIEGDHGRIKPLQVAYLHDTPFGFGYSDQFISLVKGGCHGLLNQHIQITVHTFRGNGKMMLGRHHNADSIDVA